MAEFKAGDKVRIIKFGSGYGADHALVGKTGVVLDVPSSYIPVKIENADGRILCMNDELELIEDEPETIADPEVKTYFRVSFKDDGKEVYKDYAVDEYHWRFNSGGYIAVYYNKTSQHIAAFAPGNWRMVYNVEK